MRPFHVNGSKSEHIVESKLIKVDGSTVKLSVTTLSHPLTVCNVNDCVVVFENVNPFQLKGVSFSQIVTISFVLYVGFIESTMVAIESHPPALVSVTD
jgi:hypothetical protein